MQQLNDWEENFRENRLRLPLDLRWYFSESSSKLLGTRRTFISAELTSLLTRVLPSAPVHRRRSSTRHSQVIIPCGRKVLHVFATLSSAGESRFTSHEYAPVKHMFPHVWDIMRHELRGAPFGRNRWISQGRIAEATTRRCSCASLRGW